MTEPDASPPAPVHRSLVQRLAAVKEAIGAVGKDGTMAGRITYKYRGIDAILNAAHSALVEHEVVIVPEHVTTNYEMRETREGNPNQWCVLTVTWAIYGPTPGDKITASTIGEALDTSDKASNKAATAAFKVLLGQLFAIPYEGEDPDAHRIEMERSKPISTEQLADIMAKIHDLSHDMQERIRPMVKAGTKLDQLPEWRLEEALAFLGACAGEDLLALDAMGEEPM